MSDYGMGGPSLWTSIQTSSSVPRKLTVTGALASPCAIALLTRFEITSAARSASNQASVLPSALQRSLYVGMQHLQSIEHLLTDCEQVALAGRDGQRLA